MVGGWGSAPLRRFAACEHGSVLIVFSILSVVILLFAALAVDLGSVQLTKRRLQSATDAAALAAAENPGDASDIASTLLRDNGFPAARIAQLLTGQYKQDPSIAIGSRFVSGATPLNAVKVSTSYDAPLYFASALLSIRTMPVKVRAIAAEFDEAGLVAGSGLVGIDQGLINAILGAMLGTNLTLTAVQYQGLLNTSVSAFDFMSALATGVNLTSGTYSQLLSSNVTMGQLVQAELVALQKEGVVTTDQINAQSGLQLLKTEITGSPTVSLGSLIDAGVWQNMPVGAQSAPTALQAALNLYQLTSFAAQLANGSNAVAVTGATSIPGVATVDLRLTGIEPPQGSYIALGQVGTSVHTAQVRVLLTVNLLSALSLGLSSAPVSLPIYLELADGTASITGISCGSDPATDSTVTVRAGSGVANAYVGSVDPSLMSNFTSSPTVSPATLVNVAGLVRVTGSAQVAVQGNTSDLTFTAAQIASRTAQTVTSQNMTGNLLRTLGSSLNLTVTTLGLSLPTGSVASSLTTLLSPAFAGLDSVTDSILRTLGIRLGYLDVWVPGVRCGVPALMQ
ncbi:MAG TPA: pilus assembly protein TadG-related protein [Dongiaceae bacterium]|nr:pilus assembly protein TadG-related protein [Dongiaceae bacterium]